MPFRAFLILLLLVISAAGLSLWIAQALSWPLAALALAALVLAGVLRLWGGRNDA